MKLGVGDKILGPRDYTGIIAEITAGRVVIEWADHYDGDDLFEEYSMTEFIQRCKTGNFQHNPKAET